MEGLDDYPQLHSDQTNGFCRRRSGRMDFRHHLASVDVSGSSSASSAGGATKFGNITAGSNGISNTTLIIIAGIVAALGAVWLVIRAKGGR
jgi:hypothetical protein